MNHKANWKEIEEAWIELADCVCKSKLEVPCLHCDSDSFKVWYHMKFGEAAFSEVYDYGADWSYYPIICLDGSYDKACCLPWFLTYSPTKVWNLYSDSTSFKTVKEAVMGWRERRKWTTKLIVKK